jgi:acyl dehydratase
MTALPEFDIADLDGLSAACSEEFGPWGTEIEVTQDLINAFAELTGDRQWIHVDVERANRESPFGGPIAHGFLTLALLPQFKAAAVRVTGGSSATNYGSDGLRFLAPVPAGSSLHARARLISRGTIEGTLLTAEVEVAVVDARSRAHLPDADPLPLSADPDGPANESTCVDSEVRSSSDRAAQAG